MVFGSGLFNYKKILEVGTSMSVAFITNLLDKVKIFFLTPKHFFVIHVSIIWNLSKI